MRKLELGLVLSLLAGCHAATVESTQQPIVGGTTTTGYPNVGYVSSDYGGGTSSGCTGTLVRDHFVLTASHCIEEDMGKVMGVKVTFEADANNATTWHTAKSWQQHPNYGKPVPPDPVYYINRGYDCALIELDAPVVGVTPISYGSTAMDTTWVGKPVTQVGYGFTMGNSTDGSGIKRELHTTIGDVVDGVLGLAENGTGTCQGDSGGPTLYDTGGGALQVIGVSSYGSQGCPGGGYMSRTELCAAWLDSVAGPFQAPADMATSPADLATAPAPDMAQPSTGGGGSGGVGSGGNGAGGNGDQTGTGTGTGMGSGKHGCDFVAGAAGAGPWGLFAVALALVVVSRSSRGARRS
jgi:V8-like Glu-specific endopeptidase